jgi:tetratricopeptide (TPR) repeat protein
VAAIVGEAGVGKSRLVYELTHSHRLQGWLVLESASVSYGKATSYRPVIDLLKDYFKIQGRDDLREAEDLARRALDSARDLKERGHEAWGWWHLAEIVANSGPSSSETAKEHYDRAARIATELGMRPVVAHCHLGLGKLYRRTGKHQQAQEPLTTATTIYRDMDMRFGWEQAEAEMGA